jgi:hypothetical protein
MRAVRAGAAVLAGSIFCTTLLLWTYHQTTAHVNVNVRSSNRQGPGQGSSQADFPEAPPSGSRLLDRLQQLESGTAPQRIHTETPSDTALDHHHQDASLTVDSVTATDLNAALAAHKVAARALELSLEAARTESGQARTEIARLNALLGSVDRQHPAHAGAHTMPDSIDSDSKGTDAASDHSDGSRGTAAGTSIGAENPGASNPTQPHRLLANEGFAQEVPGQEEAFDPASVSVTFDSCLASLKLQRKSTQKTWHDLQDGPLYWLHIPKCGTSFGAALHGYTCTSTPTSNIDPANPKGGTCERCGVDAKKWRGYDHTITKSIPFEQRPYCDWNVSFQVRCIKAALIVTV